MTLTMLPLEEVIEDLSLYPRSSVSVTNVANLVAALQAGDTLPPPVVDRKSKRIVDGVHRCRAYRRVYGDDITIEADLVSFKTDAALFAAAVELNVGHGLPLQEIEKRRVVLRLREMGTDDAHVARLLHTTPARVQRLVMHSAVVTLGGGELRLEPLKRPLFHFQGMPMSEQQVAAARTAPGTPYGLLVRQLREAIQFKLLDLTDQKLIADLANFRSELDEFLAPLIHLAGEVGRG